MRVKLKTIITTMILLLETKFISFYESIQINNNKHGKRIMITIMQ